MDYQAYLVTCDRIDRMTPDEMRAALKRVMTSLYVYDPPVLAEAAVQKIRYELGESLGTPCPQR
jgi:hypothetical protein